MQASIKATVIGGGSSYTPELIEGLIKRRDELPLGELWLVDIEEGKERVEIVRELAKRMFEANNCPVRVYATLDRRKALKGADFVITQFRVGQLQARIKDERIPPKHGLLGQETNGAGGILKALRTIPVMQEIVADMRELCPDAWLINFTNPSGMVTEAVIKHFKWEKCVGLCNVPIISIMREPKLLGLEPCDVEYRFAGINHFHWHRVFDKVGNELTEKILPHINDENGGTPVNIPMLPFTDELLNSMRLIPCGYHRYYYMERDMLEHSLEDMTADSTRAEKMLEVERSLFELYKNSSLNKKPAELEKRGGAHYSDTACECISAIYNDKRSNLVVCTKNRGAISCLDDESIVEVSSIISKEGATPIKWGGMRSPEKGWLQLMKAMEECVIEAAINGDYGLALEAFTLNPLIRGGTAAKLTFDELLLAHEAHLPRFADKIREIKKASE